jgi:hypothetical protein
MILVMSTLVDAAVRLVLNYVTLIILGKISERQVITGIRINYYITTIHNL